MSAAAKKLTPIERSERTRIALLEAWPVLEAADAYSREYAEGSDRASFMHGALYAVAAYWQQRHGVDNDIYCDLDDELHETIEAGGDLNARIRHLVEVAHA